MKYRVTINAIIQANGVTEERLDSIIEKALNNLTDNDEEYHYIDTKDLIIDVKERE